MRGGHAAGYADSNGKNVTVKRKLGYWSSAKRSFIKRAAERKMVMMHARYATCGKRAINEAHPFEIRRNGKVVLYGAHNGQVYNAHQSAKKHNRKIAVDSEEIFQLLADDDYDGIKELEGYGVITWIDMSKPDSVFLLRLSDKSDIFVVETKDKNVVYGSTEKIVCDALDRAKMDYKHWFDIDVGKIYEMTSEGLFVTETKDIVFKTPKWKNKQTINEPSQYFYYREYPPKQDYNEVSNNQSQVKSQPINPKNHQYINPEEFVERYRRAEETYNNREAPTEADLEAIEDSSFDADVYCDNCGNEVEDDYEDMLYRTDISILCRSCLMEAVA